MAILDYNLRGVPYSGFRSEDHIRCGVSSLSHGVDKIFSELKERKKDWVDIVRLRDISFGIITMSDLFCIEFNLQKSETTVFVHFSINENILKSFEKLFLKNKKISFLTKFSILPIHDVTAVVKLLNSPLAEEVYCQKISHQGIEDITLSNGYFNIWDEKPPNIIGGFLKKIL